MTTEGTKTTRKRNTSKTTKKPDVETTEEVIVEEPVVEKKEVRRKKHIDLNIQVPCRNVEDGKLIYVSPKTGLKVIWSENDDVEFLDVGELLTMKASLPAMLNDPRLVIDDEDVAEYLGLNKLYDSFIDLDDLESFFDKTPDEMKKILDKLPKGLKSAIATRARKKVEDESLYDNRKIRLLEDKLKIDLTILL